MSISQTEQIKSAKFMESLNNLLTFVEEMLPYINEQKYVMACNDLQTLHKYGNVKTPDGIFREMIRDIENNEVVRLHRQRLKMKVKDKNTQLCDADKLSNGWKACPKCDRIVLNITQHQYSDVCQRVHESKKLTLNSKKLDTAELSVFIHKLRGWAIKWGKRKFYA